MKKIVLSIISFINIFYPKDFKQVVFISSPDMSDNSFAFFKYMIDKHSSKYVFIWLLEEKNNLLHYESMIKENIIIDNITYKKIKFISRNSFMGFYYYVSSKYIFFTHGFFTGMSLPKTQVRVNLWHGMPLKALGYLLNSKVIVPKTSYTIATSKLFQGIMSKVFNSPNESVLVVGQPRYDLFYTQNSILHKLYIDKNLYKQILFWAPTFRRAMGKDMKDGDFSDGLPIVGIDNLNNFNHYLKKLNIFLLIKLHPMDILNNHIFKKMTNIKVIRNKFLLDNNIQLYSLLSHVDILITDFSSIYIDFLLLDKPIIFLSDDFDSYENSRGFTFDNPKEYMPGEFVTTYKNLKIVIDRLVIEKNDNYIAKRLEIRKLFHKYENNFSHRLYKLLDMQ